LEQIAAREPARAGQYLEQREPDMRSQRIVLSLAIAIGGAATATAAVAEEYRGTWEQQMACTPDVWRLCSDQVPDVQRIVACLRQNTPQLSNNCRAVFESNAQQQQTQGRAQQPQMQGRAPQQPQMQQRPRAPQPVQPAPSRPPFDDED
jgi:hypothetical protein